MMRHDFSKYRSEVSGEREIAALVELLGLEPRPLAVHLATSDVPTDHEQRTGVPVISTAIAVLARHATELGHCHDHDVVHAIAEVGDERRDRAGEIIQPLRELAR